MELGLFGTIVFVFLILRFILSDAISLIQYIEWFFQGRFAHLIGEFGDWAVVTGASDGIGKAYSVQLASKGINIVLIGRNKLKLETVSKEIDEKFKVKTKIIIADFAKGREIYDDIKKGLEGVTVGILVNNVGVQYNYPMAVAELPESEIWDNLNINLASAVMMSRIILPQMIAAKKGAIINFSSASSFTPQPYMTLYAASKAYMSYFSDALRWEVRKQNITVQTLTPFYVSSKINHFQETLQKKGLFIPDVDTYAEHAIKSLGVLDNTTGYWSHRIQGFFYLLVPSFIRIQFLGATYKKYNRLYVKKLETSAKSKDS